MNIVKFIFIAGTLFTLPAIASADRCDYGRSNFSRPYFSNNSNWNRPQNNNYGYNNFGYNNFGRNNSYGYTADSRIRAGVQSGQLSRNELQELRDKQREIGQERRDYWSDGYLSKNERKDLQKDQKNYDKFLNHNLNDGERANRGWFGGWR